MAQELLGWLSPEVPPSPMPCVVVAVLGSFGEKRAALHLKQAR